MRPALPKSLLIASALLLAAAPARAEEDGVFDEAFPPRDRAPLGLAGGTAQASFFSSEAILGAAGASHTLFGGTFDEAHYAKSVNQSIFYEAAGRLKAKRPELADRLDSYLQVPQFEYLPSEGPGAPRVTRFEKGELKKLDALLAEERQLITIEMAQGRVPPSVQATFEENKLRARKDVRVHRAIVLLSPILFAQAAIRAYELYHDRNPGYFPLFNLGSAYVRRELLSPAPAASAPPQPSSPDQED